MSRPNGSIFSRSVISVALMRHCSNACLPCCSPDSLPKGETTVQCFSRSSSQLSSHDNVRKSIPRSACGFVSQLRENVSRYDSLDDVVRLRFGVSLLIKSINTRGTGKGLLSMSLNEDKRPDADED